MNLIDEAIKEFLTLEAIAESMRAQAYKARVALERVNAPAPKGASKKVLSNSKKAQLVTTLRKSLLKPRQQ